MQPPGDHQVQHQPELSLQADGDPLAKPAQRFDRLVRGGLERRVERPQQKRAVYAHTGKGPADNPALESFQVDRNVGQLGHEC